MGKYQILLFIEIGAHRGESYQIAKNPKYGFDEFWLFEPSQNCILFLRNFRDIKIKIFGFGLGNSNFKTNLFNSGTKGASIYRAKFLSISESKSETIQIRKASEVLGDVLSNDRCFLKINCEGSEIAILNDLMDQNLLSNKHSILVDFDIKKVTKDYSVILKDTLDRLKESGVNYHDSGFFQGKWTEINVKRWLDKYLLDSGQKVTIMELIRYKTNSHLKINMRIYRTLIGLINVSGRRKITKFYYRIMKQR